MRSPLLRLLPLLLLASCAPASGSASAGAGGDEISRTLAGPGTTYRVTLRDPMGDDNGPGNYTYPTGAAFPDGTFDLTAVTIAERGEFLEVEVHIRGEFREWDYSPTPAQRLRAIPQVIDIYIDQDGVPGSGKTHSLPGRRIAIDQATAWDKVLVVASPQVARQAAADGREGQVARNAVLPIDLRVAGNRLVARYNLAETGRPTARWGYAVAMFGASFVSTPELARRFGKNDFSLGIVRDVRRIAGACSSIDDPNSAGCAFGGCEPCEGHPRAIDIIVPPGRQQSTVLSSYSPGKPAVITAVFPFGQGP
jgi:hypothetical protein